MVLKLTEHVRNTISTPPPLQAKTRVNFRYLELFLAKNSILAYISLKIGILRSAMFENVIVTSYIG